MSLRHATLSDLLSSLEEGTLSSVEMTQQVLSMIEAENDTINAVVTLNADEALATAKSIDERRANNENVGSLAGVPIALKDLICTQGLNTTCASRMLENYRPPYDATVTRKLRDAGAVIVGKLNMDEFAMGSSTETSAHGPTSNPWKTTHSPGGSSGGSSAAVGAGWLPVTLGSDTGGSIRQPAGFCGVAGLKPTYGRVSRFGLVAFASSLDQIGPISNDLDGAARVLEVISGKDPNDSTSLDHPVPRYSAALDQPLESLTIGVVKEQQIDGVDSEVLAAMEEAIAVYRKLGATIREISMPHIRHSVAAYYLIAPSEASSNLARYDGVHYGRRADEFDDMIDMYAASRSEGFGAEVKRRIMLGTYALSAGYSDRYYRKALQVRRLIRNDFDEAFKDVDVILGPVTPTPAFELNAIDDPLTMYLADVFTIPANLAGIPGLSIPAGISSDGLPIGIQLLAPNLEEERLLRAGRMFERETDWHTRRPSGSWQSSLPS